MKTILPADGAIMAACAEAMHDAGVANPPLDSRLTSSWSIIGYLTALDALFGAQDLNLGDRVYYGFVAQSLVDSMQYVAVIRGTESPVEWLEDFDAILVRTPPVGSVSHGFWAIYASMRMENMLTPAGNHMLAAQAINERLPEGSSVTVIGHSLGAALGTYLMTDIARIPYAAGQREITVGGMLFASPKPGDEDFARDVDATVGVLNYTVHNYIRDVVVHMPPSLPFGIGFQPLANIDWIKPSQAHVTIDDNIVCNHAALSYAALLGADVVTSCIVGVPA